MGNMKETFGVPVRSTYTKEVVLLVCAAVATGTSILLFVMSMSSRHWIFVSTKAAYKWVPYLTFDLGLLGGVATMHAQAGGFENESSVSFEYKDSNQYCPDDQCVALYQAGLVCVVLLSLSVAASFVALIVEVVVMLQLGNVLSETGPFGPYVNYQKCNRNMIWGSIPEAHKSDAVTWHPGWSVWASNLLGVLLEAFASFLVCRSVNLSRHPFSGYSSII